MSAYKEFRPIDIAGLTAILDDRYWPTWDDENEGKQLIKRLAAAPPHTHYTTEMILEIAETIYQHSVTAHKWTDVKEIEISHICFLIGQACPTFFIPDSLTNREAA